MGELFEQALKPPPAPEPMEVQKDESSDKIEATNGKDETWEKENEGGKKEKKKKKKKDKKKLEETTEDVNTKPSSRKRKSSDRDENEEKEEVMQGAPTKPEGWQSAPEPKKPAISFNKWEGADMGSDAQTEKFRRLMGIKAAPKPKEVASNWGRDDKKMLRDLEQGFEKARETHFGGRS